MGLIKRLSEYGHLAFGSVGRRVLHVLYPHERLRDLKSQA